MSVPAWQFAERWADAFGNERIPWRAARMYDALTIIDDAVSTLDERLPDVLDAVLDRRDGVKLAFIHIDLYRELLRDEIQRATLNGASGTIAFDRQGDMLADSYVAELGGDGRLHSIAGLANEHEVAAARSGDVAHPRLTIASTPAKGSRP